MAPVLRGLMPLSWNGYFEPFAGSGALFFATRPERATLSDVNDELINCYEVVRDDVEALIRSLRRHVNTLSHFQLVRANDPATLSFVQRASRFIFLNRTCFNGLYRVNRLGRFNTPYGYYARGDVVQATALRAASAALRGVRLAVADYQSATEQCKKSDFVYLDPPYVPVGKYSDFRRYHKLVFTNADHVLLAERFGDLDRRGCFVMLSNSNHPLVRKLYRKWSITRVQAPRSINSDGEKRGAVSELVITNY